MGWILGIWIGSTLTALSYVRRHKVWGAVGHPKGWEWLACPYFAVLGLWHTRPWRKV